MEVHTFSRQVRFYKSQLLRETVVHEAPCCGVYHPVTSPGRACKHNDDCIVYPELETIMVCVDYGDRSVVCVSDRLVPFIVKLQRVLPIQRSHQLPDHRLRLLPLVSPQHPDVGDQPGHRAYGHTAYLPLNVVSDLLHSDRERDDIRKKRGRKETGF